jgi:DNA-binding GntR family transcriptional regulator
MNRDSSDREETSFLPRVVLSERVKEFVIDAILRGEFKPGDRIIESSLARRLGVSQAPVREGLRDLVLQGFLQIEPYKGTTVRSFSRQELYEVYTVRAALESLAARLATLMLTEADVSNLKGILEEMIEAARKEDRDRTVQLNNYFHETILKISGNKMLRQLWQTLQFGHWTFVTTFLSHSTLEELSVRHEQLLDALMSRDPQRAMLAMQHHIEDLGESFNDLELEHKLPEAQKIDNSH